MKLNKPIRLYWGENYSEKSEKITDALRQACEITLNSINLYPGSLYDEVIGLIAKTHKLKKEQIVFGHGIEGLIHLTTESLLEDDQQGGMFKPSFFVYEENLKRHRYITVPCQMNEKIDVAELLRKIQDTKIFFLASPNTRTGDYLLAKNEIQKILDNYEGILVIDECYFGLGDQTAIDLIDKYDNLLILRGVTKVMGLASLRFAFAIGQKKIIDRLKINLTDIELDPISSFPLEIFKAVYPYFEDLASASRKFFTDFTRLLAREFSHDIIIPTVTTFVFMDISRYKKEAYEIMNYLTRNGYIMSDSILSNNDSITFPNLIELTPPPQEYWDDFISVLKSALD